MTTARLVSSVLPCRAALFLGLEAKGRKAELQARLDAAIQQEQEAAAQAQAQGEGEEGAAQAQGEEEGGQGEGEGAGEGDDVRFPATSIWGVRWRGCGTEKGQWRAGVYQKAPLTNSQLQSNCRPWETLQSNPSVRTG